MPADALKRARLLCSGVLLLATILHWSAASRLPHGLTATYYEDPSFSWAEVTRVERVASLSANDALVRLDNPFKVFWDGYIYLDAPQAISFRIPPSLNARLVIDNQEIFNTATQPDTRGETARLPMSIGLHRIAFELIQPTASPSFFVAGLEWDTWIGPRHIPPPYLYPTEPHPDRASEELRRMRTRNTSKWLGLLAAVGLAAIYAGSLRTTLLRRDTFRMTLIVGLALALRLIYLHDLVTQKPNFDTLPDGSDHRTYEADARDLVRGLWPPDTDFYRQPGFVWILGHYHLLLGPGLRTYQIIQLSSGALASIAVYAIGRHIFGSATGWIAALLWATFPLGIFYDAQLVTHGFESQLIPWITWIWIRALKPGSNQASIWAPPALLGLLLGIASVVRPAMLALIPIAVLTLTWTYSNRSHPRPLRGVLLLAIATLPILPVTLHNYEHTGRFQAISANGPVTLYLGNNRDSAGIGQQSLAFRTTHERVNRGEVSYIGQTITDIREAPQRWLGLMARKTALYWGALEIPNNVDFQAEATAISPLIRLLPMRFGPTVALAFAGLSLAARHPRTYKPGLWLLCIILLMLFTTTVIFHVVSRFRTPTYALLILPAAFVLVETGQRIARQELAATARAATHLAAGIMLVLLMPWFAEHSLAPPTLVTLPTDTAKIDKQFARSVTLLGHRSLPAVEPGEPLTITLYWTSTSKLHRDYYGSVQLFSIDGHKLTQTDQPMGTGSFPQYPSTAWSPGEIISDQYLIVPPSGTDAPMGLQLLIAAYDRETGERIGEATVGPLSLTYTQPLFLPDDVTPVQASIGPAWLAAYQATEQDDSLSITLYWESRQASTVDGVVFLHLFDTSGNFIAGYDDPPLSGRYPMSAWQPGEGISDTHLLQLRGLPSGEYTVYAGIYDPATGTRFPITDKAGSHVPDGTLQLIMAHSH